MTALLAVAPTLARASVFLYQCENGYTGTTDCLGAAPPRSSTWTRGNATTSNYRQGDFVPMRAVFTATGNPAILRGHTYVIRIGYDAVVGGLHAYDYLGTYDSSAREGQVIRPCSVVVNTAGDHDCSGDPADLKARASRTALPLDPGTTFLHPPEAREDFFYAWGVTLVSATYPAGQPPIVPGTTGTVERFIDLTFRTPPRTDTLTGSVGAVIAWGAHIAHVDNWGADQTLALQGGGGPFKVRLKDSLPAASGDVMGFEPGNRELPLTTIRRPAFTTGVTIRNPGPPPAPAAGSVNLGGSVTDIARLSGKTRPAGTVRFFFCFDPSGAPNCMAGGRLVGHDEVVAATGTSNTGTAAIDFTPRRVGIYCFRAEYTPSGLDTPFLPAQHTNQTLLTSNSSTTAECFRVNGVEGPQESTLTVKKVCVPENDAGRFDITIDGATTAAGTVGCGGSIGPIPVTPGGHTVAEAGAGGTNLAAYKQMIACGSDVGGFVDIAEGEHVTCVISNVRHSEESKVGQLTLLKVCAPESDGGLFNLRIDGVTADDAPCGGAIGPVALLSGTYHVGETAGTATDLSAYTRVIGGACRADGSVRLSAGQSKTCTITNVRHGTPTAVLTVRKRCRPADDNGRFVLDVDEQSFSGMRCAQSTGPITVSIGTHLVGEVAVPANISAKYVTRFGGDCDASGLVTLRANQHATCTVTNSRIRRVNAANRPARAQRPPKRPRPKFTG